MSMRLYVVDTSYLIEIAACGRDSIPKVTTLVRNRFKKEAKAGSRFFVPLPCLFELGNHIADVGHEGLRLKLSLWLKDTVVTSLEKSRPWIITPTANPGEVLPVLMESFIHLAPKMKIGLVDAFTIDEAKRLKSKAGIGKPKVHIWTNDYALKQQEPDSEHEPFLWRSDGSPR